jgi:transmembrane sensor
VAENKNIQDWLDTETSSGDRHEIERILAITETMEVPVNTTKAQAWDQLLSKIDNEGDVKERILVPEKTNRRNWIKYMSAAAAVILLGVYYFNLSPNSQIDLNTGIADIQIFTLPDNSVVHLNANSSISYDEKNWSENRVLDFEGEGFFEVASGSDFIVNTSKGAIKVVGTEFNVFSREGLLKVACFEGAVAVTNVLDQTQLLEVGSRATIDANSERLNIESFDFTQTATWRIGEFYFNEANLASVVSELERQFNITIEIDVNIEYRTYSGYFDNKSQSEALQLVFNPMGLKFKVEGDKVIVQ